MSDRTSFIPKGVVDVEWITRTSATLKPMNLTLEDSAREAALNALREVLTEENTDHVIDLILDRLRLPIWLRWLPIRSVLDRLLPDALLNVFEDILG